MLTNSDELEINPKQIKVLIFPPVNNYRRFLIHQLVQDRFGDLLQTFSIGQGIDRRTVVCYKSDFIGTPPQLDGITLQRGNNIVRKIYCTMGIESQCSPMASPEHNIQRPKQVKTSPSVEIYVPPALRRTKVEKSPARPTSVELTPTTETSVKSNRQKRPDRAVYVPRHRRSIAETDSSNVSATETHSKSSSKEQPRVSKRPIERVPPVQRTYEEIQVSTAEKMKPAAEPIEICRYSTVEQETVAPVEAINVTVDETAILESLMDEMESELASTISTSLLETRNEQIIVNNDAKTEIEVEHMNVRTKEADVVEAVALTDSEKKVVNHVIKKKLPHHYATDTRNLRKSADSDAQSHVSAGTRSGPLSIKSDSSEIKSETVKHVQNLVAPKIESCDDSSNDKVVKKSLVSKVLIISTADDLEDNPQESNKNEQEIASPMTPPEKKVKKIERPKSKPVPPPAPPVKIDRDECDWDSLFDDNGDCLDPMLIEELTSSVGEVVIEKPQSISWKSLPRPAEVSSDEFAHVLEIYNFPSDYKTSDLTMVFSPFRDDGFELKWVDDTHCLAVFSSPLVAAEVLASNHPFVKTRPLSQATALSKTKARRSFEYLQPYRTRPETCAALARRLVTKSLGVTLATAKQEREHEKIILREAKEKRRLAIKQSEEIWEGIITPKSTT
ncbi:coiled-coil domain-containing protein R3HCC1L isoform X2 [Copidosoma floridanum]|uniref:coiled-coil domain-containing protein R3HCC1L isoform X2 n=1 Tax=Copidosoma floridanum TaxID=29053 RepID=UPI0006C94B1B|nr:coiled-coil domain-containing protein R3HCC1L isoform X2 [Copidosoma floridanum]